MKWFLLLIVLLMVYRTFGHQASTGELWFMLCVFAAVAYIAGFLDSRTMAARDQQRGNHLAEIEQRHGEDMICEDTV